MLKKYVLRSSSNANSISKRLEILMYEIKLALKINSHRNRYKLKCSCFSVGNQLEIVSALRTDTAGWRQQLAIFAKSSSVMSHLPAENR